MSRLNAAPEIVDLADQLGLGGAANPVDAILRHCRTRIDRWVAEARGVTDHRRTRSPRDPEAPDGLRGNPVGRRLRPHQGAVRQGEERPRVRHHAVPSSTTPRTRPSGRW